ncbi:MAG TPA: prolyl oligopeptidase family serine peptidase, partial [Bryobacteraceae bacterium]|nr:prolyl oligopeptidase family serine peptidase [Bryobacteraceae bacterium]
EFDEPTYTIFIDDNEEYITSTLRFLYNSLVTPRSIYDYDMSTRARELKKRYAVLGGYDPAQYASERIFATAPDGAQVPISLVYRRDTPRDGTRPLYLYGYGSYGIVTEPSFSSERLSLLDRGWIFAMAHIRGSGDLGRVWYEDGKLLHKKNSFTDFIACAGRLMDGKYTSNDRLAIAGGSAGGLLMGAVMNLRPDLFHIVIAHVPFVDVINTMLDETLPLTVAEYDEWGNPNEKPFFDYMRSYAPYENVQRTDYPNVLVTAGLNDPRVSYWEPAKWVAKLRDRKTDSNIIVLRTNMGAGHGGPSGRYSRLKEKAFEYAFLLMRSPSA